jgi:hypothetical protein
VTPEVITNYEFVRQPVPTLVPNAYVFAGKSRLARWLFGRLLKAGVLAPWVRTDLRYERRVLKLDAVLEQLRAYALRIYAHEGTEPTKVILGGKQMRALECEVARTTPFLFSRVPLRGHAGLRLCDMEVILNPYIDGVVVY